MTEWLTQSAAARLKPASLHTYASVGRGAYQSRGWAGAKSRTTPYTVQVFLNGRTQAGLKANTVSLIRTVLSMAFRQAEDWGWTPRNLVTKTRGPAPDARKRPARGKADALRFIEVCQSEHVDGSINREGRIPLLLLLSGLRIGEARGLRWEFVDLE